MTGTPLPDTLPALRNYLAAQRADSLRHAFEQHIQPVVGVEFRRLFSPGQSDESLVEIPLQEFARIDPHPYAALGAPYDGHSPFHLRRSVLQRLQLAQNVLRALRPGWSLQIFDAWRPLEVQRFMVEHAFAELAAEQGLAPQAVDAASAAQLWDQVFSIWARPLEDAAMPPPHSTGAAIDITLLDADNNTVDMGSAIDAFGAVSLPAYFANSDRAAQRQAHSNRELLARAMSSAGFQRHPYEWWHFSYGDQLWALSCWLDAPAVYPAAIYGGVQMD